VFELRVVKLTHKVNGAGMRAPEFENLAVKSDRMDFIQPVYQNKILIRRG